MTVGRTIRHTINQCWPPPLHPLMWPPPVLLSINSKGTPSYIWHTKWMIRTFLNNNHIWTVKIWCKEVRGICSMEQIWDQTSDSICWNCWSPPNKHLLIILCHSIPLPNVCDRSQWKILRWGWGLGANWALDGVQGQHSVEVHGAKPQVALEVRMCLVPPF